MTVIEMGVKEWNSTQTGSKPSFPLADTRKWRNSGKNEEIRLENVAM
jgi:hypothetical protein